jgi:hypothetical protein
MPESARIRDLQSAPRGVVVSAGLKALDEITSHGINVGYKVNIICQAPYRMEIARIKGHSFYLLVLRAGDIVASTDLRDDLNSGVCKISYDEQSGQHLYTDANGKTWMPVQPLIDETF